MSVDLETEMALFEGMEDIKSDELGYSNWGDEDDWISDIPIITLTDEFGEEYDFELLDVVRVFWVPFMVLTPAYEEAEASEVIIVEICQTADPEVERYVTVNDEALIAIVFGIFKFRNKDLYDFQD